MNSCLFRKATEGRLTKEDVINISPYLSASLKNGVDYYVNNKIPYAFNYCSQTTDTLKDFHTHGTHVAGIAAGNGEAETSGKYDPNWGCSRRTAPSYVRFQS